MEGYHWHYDLYFSRIADGYVHIWNEKTKAAFSIPPKEWAELVATVSAKGWTAEQISAAETFHSES